MLEGAMQDGGELNQSKHIPAEFRDAIDVFRSKYFFHVFTEMLPACLFAKDREGRYIFVNDEFVKISEDNRREEIIGRRPSEILDPERGKRAETEDHQIMETGQSLINQINLDHLPNGENRYFMVSKIPVRDSSNQVIGLAGMLYDITERKEKENELKELYDQVEQKNKQMEADLELAKEVQRAFMSLDQQGVDESGISIEVEHHASNKLGGDLFISKEISTGVWSVFICDVMGHGVRAALITALLRGLHDEVIRNNWDPSSFLTKLNDRYLHLLASLEYTVFATCTYAVFDLNKKLLSYGSAGHHLPICIENGRELKKADSLAAVANPAIGIVPEFQFVSSEIPLKAGDRYLFFTDGVWEVPIDGNDPETNAFLIQETIDHADKPEREILQAIVSKLVSPGAKMIDDVCLALVGVR